MSLRFATAPSIWTGSAALALGIALAGPASGEPYRAQSTGTLLVTVEGAPESLSEAARPLVAAAAGAAVTSSVAKLLDVDVDTSTCISPATGLGSEQSIRRVLAVREKTAAGGLAARTQQSAGEAWEAAYQSFEGEGAAAGLAASLATSGVQVLAIEPDLVWTDTRSETRFEDVVADRAAAPGDTHSISKGPDSHWPTAAGVGWHLEASQLDEARRKVEERLPSQGRRVKIAHFDTGYPHCEDSGLPPNLNRQESWDFSALSCPDKCDPTRGAGEKGSGHGTGTLSILAGGRVRVTPPGGSPFDGTLGGAPFADVVEYRIANSVIVWQPSKVARALDWASRNEVDVVSMSMGGPPSFTLHQAVNEAYCRGIAMVTATGNNVRAALIPFSSPRRTVFPARYDRVLGAAGITADRRTYASAPWRWGYLRNPFQLVMRGNAGPGIAMEEALVAFTPNVAWLDRPSADCSAHSLRLNGAGTSSATPQIAAAAAAWLQYHSADLLEDWRTWRKTEAVYRALLDTADRDSALPRWRLRSFGAGVVRARTAIDGGIPDELTVRRHARLGWGWLAELLLGIGPGPLSTATARSAAPRNMLATEIAQLQITSPDLGESLDQLEADRESASAREDAITMLADEPLASPTLRRLAAAAQAKGL